MWTTMWSRIQSALRDPTWQFIGVLISLLALLAPYFASKQETLNGSVSVKKHLAISAFQQSLIPEEERNKISFSYDKVSVPPENMQVRLYGVYNKSGKNLDGNDFVTPLKIAVAPNAKILFVKTASNNNSPAPDVVHFDGKSALIKPQLLNSGESFWVQIMLVLDKPAETDASQIDDKTLTWSGAIKGATLKAPGEEAEPDDSLLNKLGLSVIIKHQDYAVIALVLVATIFMIAQLLILKPDLPTLFSSPAKSALFVLRMVLSWAAAEVIVHAVSGGGEQPPVAWIGLGLFALTIAHPFIRRFI